MSQTQTRDRIKDRLYAGFILSMIACVVTAFLNNELAYTISFFIMLAVGATYVVRRLVLRRRRNRTSSGVTA